MAQDALTNQDLGAASVGSSEVADQSLTASDLGPDSVAAGELGTVTVRTNAAKVAKDASGSVGVDCAAGEQVLGGGGQPGHFGTEMTSSRPQGNGWLYQALNKTGRRGHDHRLRPLPRQLAPIQKRRRPGGGPGLRRQGEMKHLKKKLLFSRGT